MNRQRVLFATLLLVLLVEVGFIYSFMSFNHAPDNVDGEAGWTLTHEALLSLRVTASELDQRSRQQVVSLGCAGRRRRGCRGGRAKTKHNHSTGIPVDVDRRPNGHPAASTDCIRQLTLVTVTEHPSLPRYPGHRAGRPRCPVPSLRPVGNGAYDISHTPTECSGRGHRCYQRHQPESLHSLSNLTVNFVVLALIVHVQATIRCPAALSTPAASRNPQCSATTNHRNLQS